MHRIVLNITFALIATAGTARASDTPPRVIDYDTVVALSGVERFDGAPASPPVPVWRFRQAVYELEKAAAEPLGWPSADELRSDGIQTPGIDEIPLALLNAIYERQSVRTRAFAAAALKTYTYRGGHVVFTLAGRRYLSNDTGTVTGVAIDFDDGRGFVAVAFDVATIVRYATPGTKQIRVRVTLDDGRVLHSLFEFEVRALATPLPDDTLAVAATIPYNAEYGTGDGYVYLASGHTAITKPVVVLEGFDLDNSMNWDELYALLNQENLLETLRGDGYDTIVFNFTEATDPIQKNAFATIALLEQVQSMLLPQQRFPLVGASMGGLVGRYALAYMETHTLPHGVATYVSFDTPHRGANIPLGIQYWLAFFENESTDAEFLLSRLDTPAARQMLVYHHTDPPGSTPSADPLRAAFESDLAGVGNYPAIPRKVALANGSSTMATQGFAAGEKIIDYNYDITLAIVKGNVWAVPDGGPTQIFEGQLTVLFGQNRTQDVTVSGALPYDNAPGGYRASMAQMDSVEAPYGDIIALYPNHCFIPTTSALDLATSDLFYDIAGDPSLLSMTPFDAVYFPADNQSHVEVTAENAAWLLDEIRGTPTAVRGVPATLLEQNYPNPFNPTTTIRFVLEAPGPARIVLYDAAGRRVATLADRPFPAGLNTAAWDGRDDTGRPVPSGVYFYRLTTPTASVTRKMVLVR